MGYYTKLEVHISLNPEAPSEILEKLCSGQMWRELAQAKFGRSEGLFNIEEEPELPISHPFGKSKRWGQLFGNKRSYDKENRMLHIECDIKAYDNIYGLLFDWLKPFIIAGTWRTQGENYEKNQWDYETI